MENLPPGVVEEDGKLYRYVPRVSGDGTQWQQRRQVVLDPKEARAMRADYYHATLGWVLDGIKLEKDREPGDIISDSSVPVTVPADNTGSQEGET